MKSSEKKLIKSLKRQDYYTFGSDFDLMVLLFIQEKANDVRLQQEYTRLTEEMEAQRELEKKQREDKIKSIMSAFADSVVKDQKAVIREEDEKMMRHIID